MTVAKQVKKTRAPGAGVKPDDGAAPLERVQARLDEATKAVLAAIGDGNVSLGIREAARRLVEHNDIGKFDVTRHEKRRK